MQIKKKFPMVAVVSTKLNFRQYTYRFRINHKTLYSQTIPGPHFGSWTTKWTKELDIVFLKSLYVLS